MDVQIKMHSRTLNVESEASHKEWDNHGSYSCPISETVLLCGL